jgi:hypothetical protein
MRTPGTELTGAYEIAPLPFLFDGYERRRDPFARQKSEEIGLVRLSKICCERACRPIRGKGEGTARIQP